MAPPLNIDMAELTRLTVSGDLKQAMSLIKSGLGGLRAADAPAEPTPAAGDTIEMAPPAGRDGAWTARDAAPAEPAAPRKAKIPNPLPGFAAGKAAVPPVAQGASFERLSYANAAGQRAYKLYVPASYSGQPVPLVVMLHGCTQSPDDFAAGTGMNALAEEFGFLVAYPEQSPSANVSRCWNWFNAAEQVRDHGEPSLIAGITRQVMATHAVDARRVFVAGLSAGGAAAATLGDLYPELYAAIGIHSGLACGAARDMVSAFQAMREGAAGGRLAADHAVPTIVFHGDVDATVHPSNGRHIVGRGRRAGELSARTDDGQANGRTFTRTTYADPAGRTRHELWSVHGTGHAWSGGQPAGSYTDPHGPDASREMVRFFLERTAAT